MAVAPISDVAPQPSVKQQPPVKRPRPADARRAELAEYLRACRARLSPEAVGLPPGTRRRTAGLRREEVAQLAGVGITWYTWLEQGRPINASVQVLDAISRALRLDNAEHDHLLRLAGIHALPAETELAAVPGAVIEIINSLEPLPAMLINARYDIQACNSAYGDFVRHWHTVACERRNVLWCCFTEPEVRQRFVNFDAEIPRVVATLRASYAKHIGEPAWTDFIEALCARSSEFAGLWARHEVAIPGSQTKHFLHPVAGVMRVITTSFELTDMPEHRIVVYTPADDDTRQRLPLTRVSFDGAESPRQRRIGDLVGPQLVDRSNSFSR